MVKKINGIQVPKTDAPSAKNLASLEMQKNLLKLQFVLTTESHLNQALIKASRTSEQSETSILKPLSEKDHKALIQTIATLHEQSTARLAAFSHGLGDSDGDSGGGLPPWFNPSVPPPGPDGNPGEGDPSNFPNDNIWDKLMAMLKFLEEDPHNTKAMAVLQKFLENFCKAGYNSATLAKLFSIIYSISGDANTLGEFLIKFIVGNYFYTHGENEAATLAFIQALEAQLKKVPGWKNIPGLKDEIDTLQWWAAGSNLQDWINSEIVSQGPPPVYKGLANWSKQSGNVLAQLFQDSELPGRTGGIDSAINQLKHLAFELLLAKYKGDPMVALMLWFYQGQDLISEAELTGYADLLKYIQNEINDLTKLEAQLKDGGFNAATAKQFMELLEQIKQDTQNNPALAGISGNVSEFIKDIEDLQPNGDQAASLGTLFAKGDFKDLAAALNKISGALTDPTGQAMLNAIKNLNTQFSDQSTATNVQIQKITSFIQTILNSFNKTVISQDGVMGLISALVKNQRSS